MDKERHKSSRYKHVILLIIAIGIIAGMIWKVGIDDIYNKILECDPVLLIYAFLLGIFAIIVKIIRWFILYKEANFINSSKIYIVGQAINQVAPTGSGELARAYVAKSKLNIPVGATLAPAVIERIADITFLVGMAVTSISFLVDQNQYMWQLIIPIVILFIGYLLILKPNFMDKIALKLERFYETEERFLNRITNRISGILREFKGALVKFHERKKAIWLTIFLTIISWIIYAYGIYVLILAFGIQDIPFFYILIVVSTSEVIGAFSFLPGGLGAMETSLSLLLFYIVGVPEPTGWAVALVWRALGYIQLGGGSVLSLASLSKSKINEGSKD